jgi:hypothetical protein
MPQVSGWAFPKDGFVLEVSDVYRRFILSFFDVPH